MVANRGRRRVVVVEPGPHQSIAASHSAGPAGILCRPTGRSSPYRIASFVIILTRRAAVRRVRARQVLRASTPTSRRDERSRPIRIGTILGPPEGLVDPGRSRRCTSTPPLLRYRLVARGRPRRLIYTYYKQQQAEAWCDDRSDRILSDSFWKMPRARRSAERWWGGSFTRLRHSPPGLSRRWAICAVMCRRIGGASHASPRVGGRVRPTGRCSASSNAPPPIYVSLNHEHRSP